MPLMKLVIKGSEQTALNELAKRGLDARVQMNPSSDHLETIAYISEENWQVVSDWFIESSPIIPGYGFPDGTLLHYSQTK